MKKIVIIFIVFSSVLFSQQYTFDTLVRGLRTPTVFAFLPNNNVIINQQSDSTKIYNLTNGQLISCFWRFTDSLYSNPETGVMGVCLDPNFNSNHYVYIVYTDRNDSCIRIVRFTENNNLGINPFIVAKFKRQGASQYGGPHMAGNIRFGPLNKLFISIGDAGVAANAQLLTNAHGKIHRINPDGTIPTDNPFYDDGNPLTGNDDRIWAYGLRNSWDFTFSSVNDSIYSTENGNLANDEVNFVMKGRNYGWPICQGYCNPYNPLYKNPMDTLPGTGVGANYAPTGILVYNGSVMPELNGKLLITGISGTGNVQTGIIKYELGNAPFFDTIISQTIISPMHVCTTMLQGTDGYIYICKRSTASMILKMKPDLSGINGNQTPVNFSLSQNYPNPFNPVTSIRYEIAKSGFVILKIYNVLGMEVAALVNENKQAGSYVVNWDASNYPSGVYFYRLTADDFTEEKKMVLIK